MTPNLDSWSKRVTDLGSGHLRSPSTTMGTSPPISLHGIVHTACLADCLIVTEGGFKHQGATSPPIPTLKTQLCLHRTPAGKGNCWDLSKSKMSLSSTVIAFEVLLQGYLYPLKGPPDFDKRKKMGHWFCPCKGVGSDLDRSEG